MINNTLNHEVSFQTPSGSYEGEPNSILSQYNPVYGAFYSMVSIASTLNPTGSVLPEDYQGYPIFEIPRFKYGGSFNNPEIDDMGANTLEMRLVVENIGREYNTPPIIILLKHTVFTQNANVEYESNNIGKTYSNNANWDVISAPQFSIKYDDNNQLFFLQYWFSQLSDVVLIKGNYELF